MELNDITDRIISSAIKVHKALGPGLLESAYEACLLHELRKNGLKAESQVGLPIHCDGIILDVGYRVDILVEDSIIVELKAVEKIIPIHEAQLVSYLKLSGRKLGLIINFNVLLLKDGIKRMVNNLWRKFNRERAQRNAERKSSERKLGCLRYFVESRVYGRLLSFGKGKSR